MYIYIYMCVCVYVCMYIYMYIDFINIKKKLCIQLQKKKYGKNWQYS